jgi:hypothetical protein
LSLAGLEWRTLSGQERAGHGHWHAPAPALASDVGFLQRTAVHANLQFCTCKDTGPCREHAMGSWKELRHELDLRSAYQFPGDKRRLSMFINEREQGIVDYLFYGGGLQLVEVLELPAADSLEAGGAAPNAVHASDHQVLTARFAFS